MLSEIQKDRFNDVLALLCGKIVPSEDSVKHDTCVCPGIDMQVELAPGISKENSYTFTFHSIRDVKIMVFQGKAYLYRGGSGIGESDGAEAKALGIIAAAIHRRRVDALVDRILKAIQ